MTKELFIESINELQRQFEIDKKCSDAFSVILPNDFVSNYNNSPVINQLLKILKIEFNDDIRDSWIDYFVYELEFGTKYYDGMITEKNGDIVKMSNAEELYEYLIK